jgi:hypothetical protein
MKGIEDDNQPTHVEDNGLMNASVHTRFKAGSSPSFTDSPAGLRPDMHRRTIYCASDLGSLLTDIHLRGSDLMRPAIDGRHGLRERDIVPVIQVLHTEVPQRETWRCLPKTVMLSILKHSHSP